MAWGRTLTVETAPDTPVIREGENETELKLAFAAAVFELGDDWRQAGFRIFQGPDNYGRAMQSVAWINDATVQIELQRLRDDPEATLPSQAEIERRLWQIGNNATIAPKDQIAALGLLSEIKKLTKLPANINNGTINNTQNVLRVPAKPATPEEEALYEARLEKSQLKLVHDARSSGR